MKKRHEQKLIILSVGMLLILNVPFLLVFNLDGSIFGIPFFIFRSSKSGWHRS